MSLPEELAQEVLEKYRVYLEADSMSEAEDEAPEDVEVQTQDRDAPDDLAELEVGDTLAYEPPWADATQEATVEEIDEEYDEVRLVVDGEPRYVFPEDFGSSVFYDEEGGH